MLLKFLQSVRQVILRKPKLCNGNNLDIKSSMATGGDLTLNSKDIEELSEIITDKNMATIAIKYLRIEYETVENLRSKNRSDVTGINRDILVKWRNESGGNNAGI